MTSRVAGVGLLLVAAVAGCAFAPVFSLQALVLPVVAVLGPLLVVDQVCLTKPGFAPWRAVIGLVGGAVVGLVVLTLPHPPWGAAAGPVLDGALHGWRHALESTFPARPDASLLAFVPLLALIAAVIGVEWLRRGFAPLLTLVPSLVVVALAQIFRASSSIGAVALAVAYAVGAGLVLAGGRTTGSVARSGGRRLTDVLVLVLPVVLVAGLGGWALASADPLGRDAYSVHDSFQVVQVPAGAVSPLAEIGGRLAKPDTVVFTATSDGPVDRWPLVVLDGFDGAGWTTDATYRPLGSALDPDPAVTVPTSTFTARVTTAAGTDGPWLPTQERTRSVDGLRPAVDTGTGMLLATTSTATGPAYTLTWQAPQPAHDQLVGAAVDRAAPGSVQVTGLPAGIADTAKTALGAAPAPTFASALKLESWMRDNYTVATGSKVPTGSGSAQLIDFLTRSKQGTSEQFASSYVLMARSVGIPARLVVGYRQPARGADGTYVVHNGDAFAWPEVPVTGVGWVALDPTGGAKQSNSDTPSTTQATDAARQQAQSGAVPLPQQVPAAPRTAPEPTGSGVPTWLLVLAGIVVVALLVVIAVPVTKAVRRRRRRRAAGAGAVVGAWLDTRDRLRDHGVATRTSMTVRDMREPAAPLVRGADVEFERLARCVDTALWSGSGHVDEALVDQAWQAASTIGTALRERPTVERLRASVRLSSLIRPRE